MEFKLFNLGFGQLVLRFGLMMAVIIIGLFVNIPALALTALPIFISAILGLSITFSPTKAKAQVTKLNPIAAMKKAS